MSRTVFVITPIGAPDSPERRRADDLLNHVISPVVDEFNAEHAEEEPLVVVRADTIDGSGLVSHQIIEAIDESLFVITDLCGMNPNVLFELGVAEAFGKASLSIMEAGVSLPFDIKDRRTLTMESFEDGRVPVGEALNTRAQLLLQIRQLHESGYTARSLVTAAAKSRSLSDFADRAAHSGDATQQALGQLLNGVQALTDRVARMEVKGAIQARDTDPWRNVAENLNTIVRAAESDVIRGDLTQAQIDVALARIESLADSFRSGALSISDRHAAMEWGVPRQVLADLGQFMSAEQPNRLSLSRLNSWLRSFTSDIAPGPTVQGDEEWRPNRWKASD